MGPIDFTPLVYLGIIIGIVIAIAIAGLAFGGWWLLQHLVWVS